MNAVSEVISNHQKLVIHTYIHTYITLFDNAG